jgi:hypothetical protein
VTAYALPTDLLANFAAAFQRTIADLSP